MPNPTPSSLTGASAGLNNNAAVLSGQQMTTPSSSSSSASASAQSAESAARLSARPPSWRTTLLARHAGTIDCELQMQRELMQMYYHQQRQTNRPSQQQLQQQQQQSQQSQQQQSQQSQQQQSQQLQRAVPAGTAILERPVNRMRGAEVSLSAFAHLFSGLVMYLQRGVKGIKDLEEKLSAVGYQVGLRMHELLAIRDNKALKRENRLTNLLIQINQKAWRFMFGKPADGLEKSADNDDEYMINEDDLLVNKFISVPREISQLNTGAFVAGIVEAMLDASGFPARVSAHTVASGSNLKRTTILIKFKPKVIEREAHLKKGSSK